MEIKLQSNHLTTASGGPLLLFKGGEPRKRLSIIKKEIRQKDVIFAVKRRKWKIYYTSLKYIRATFIGFLPTILCEKRAETVFRCLTNIPSLFNTDTVVVKQPGCSC